MNINVPADYCLQKAAPTGSGFYYSTLHYPLNIKRNLYALHAFAAELQDLLTECSDPGVARMKLGWWAEEIQRLQQNEARHPVTRELSHLKEHFPELDTMLIKLIHHYEQQINMDQPDNYAQLMNFFMQGPGLLWQLSAKICGAKHQDTPNTVAAIGCRISWFDVLQNSRINLQFNRNYQPKDEMTVNPGRKELYESQILRLMDELRNHVDNIGNIDRYSQLHAIILAEIIANTCREIAKSGYRLEQEKINLTPLRKLWIAWNLRRKNKKFH